MTPVAISLRQPFASLLAHGIAEWHTSRARPRLEPGQEVWVHAGKQAPELGWLGDWIVVQEGIRREIRASESFHRKPYSTPIYPLPLGAVLSRHRLAEVVPITNGRVSGDHICNQHGRLAYFGDTCGLSLAESLRNLADISDQLPFADWSPGRWAWRLELIERLETPVREYVPDDLMSKLQASFGIEPTVPVRGRPGIWHLDPALIAAVRGEG